MINKELGLYHLPENWEIVSLEDIVNFTKGKKPTLAKQPGNELIPYLDIEAFEKDFIKQYASADDSVVIDDESLAMVWDGARSGLVFKGKDGALGSTLMKITPIVVKGLYLFYYLEFVTDYIRKYTKGTGIPHVDLQVLSRIQVPLPSLSEQDRIIFKIEEIFSELDNSLLKLREIEVKLNLFQQALYEENFKAAANVQWYQLRDICTISGGVTKGRNLDGKETIELPYLRVANVQDGYLTLKEVKTIQIPVKEKNKYVLSVGDILYTEGGDRDKLGRGTVWNGELPECLHQNHVFKARPKSSDYDPIYISYYSKTKAARKYFYDNGKQTTNLASINISILSNLEVPMVPLEDQKRIVNKIDTQLSIYNHSISKVRYTIEQINLTKKSILKKAFNGFLFKEKIFSHGANDILSEINRVKQLDQHNKKNRKKMPAKLIDNNIFHKDLIDILKDLKTPIPAKDLWDNSQYKGDIEKFYSALKKISHRIIENPKGYISLKEEKN